MATIENRTLKNRKTIRHRVKWRMGGTGAWDGADSVLTLYSPMWTVPVLAGRACRSAQEGGLARAGRADAGHQRAAV